MCYYKNNIAYEQSMTTICYVPENWDSEDGDGYTHQDLLNLVRGDEKLCEQLFETLSWQHPETLIDENIIDGLWAECEECNRYYDTEDEENPICPHCGFKEQEE